MNAPVRAAVPVVAAMSGEGRSVRNLIQAARRDGLAYRVVGLISSGGRSRAASLADEFGVALFERPFPREADPAANAALAEWLAGLGARWIALAGFLRMFPALPGWEGRVVNIHPALLPDFGGHGMYGDRVHHAVHGAGRRESGASIHFVSGAYDEGALIAQARVPLAPGDTPEAIAAKVFAAECHLYPLTLDRLARGELPLPEGAVFRYEYGDPSSPRLEMPQP